MPNDSDMDIPVFKSDVPEVILGKFKDPFQRHVLESQSIQQQQNEWIMRRMVDGDKRFSEIDTRCGSCKVKIAGENLQLRDEIKAINAALSSIKNWRLITVTKRGMMLTIFTMIVVPIFVTLSAEKISKAFSAPEPTKAAAKP
jgi:hypothetical protein